MSAHAFEVRRHNGRVMIQQDVDRRFRMFLLRRVPAYASNEICKALSDGPSKGGAAEARLFFGKDMDGTLDRTRPLMVLLEQERPGFLSWLEVTGFGNSVSMIKAMLKWVDSAGPGLR